MKINIVLLIIFLIVAILLYAAVISRDYISSIKKIYFTTAFVGILIYSGVSTLYVDLCEDFFIHFLIYIVVFSIAFVCSSRFKVGSYFINYSDSQIESLRPKLKKNSLMDSSNLSDVFLIVMVVLSYSYIFIQLIYPENRLGNLINISLSQRDIFNNRDYSRSLLIYQLFNYIELGTLGFYYVYLGRLVNKKKTSIAILLILLRVYLNLGLNQYISRNEIVSLLLFIALVVVYSKNRYDDLFKKTIKLFAIVFALTLILSPVLYMYQFLRLGLSLPDIDASEAISSLIYSETNYGQYYESLLELSSTKGTVNWFVWILTLPVPSAIFTFKRDIVLVNQVLSEYITGYPYGHAYYTVKLPSLFGEALYVFGILFYWLHAVFIGVFINKLSGILEKDENLSILTLWFATQSLLLGRGGSSSLVPNAVNILLFYAIIITIINYIKRRRIVSTKRFK